MKTLGLIKRGVILPYSVQEWERANDYFRDHLHLNNKVNDVNKEMKDMQNKIYKYFSETHGQVKDKKIDEHENWAKNQLKNNLKSQNPNPVEEIKRVSRVLRKRCKQRSDTDFDHQLSSTKIIGNIVKKYLNRRVKKLNQPSTKLIVNNNLEKYCLRKTV